MCSQGLIFVLRTMTREDQIARVTLVGSVVNLLLVGVKFVAGIAGHSAAMITDAVHSLSDFVTDIVVLVFVRISAQPRTRATTTVMASSKPWPHF